MKALETRRIGSSRVKNAKRNASAREASAKQNASKTEASRKQSVSKTEANNKQTVSRKQAKRKQTESKKKAPSNHAGCCLLFALALDNIEDPLVAALDLLIGQAIEAVVVLTMI